MYSRNAIESANCKNSSVSLVMKYCLTSTVKNPASVQNLLNLSCCDNVSIRSWHLCNRFSPCCAGSSVWSMCVFITPGTNNGSDCFSKTSRPVLKWQVSHSSHKSETAPWTLSWFTEIIVRKSFNRIPIGTEVYWQFSTPFAFWALLETMDSLLRKLGVPEAAGVSHHSPRAQTCTFEGPGLHKHHQNSTRRHTVRDKKSETGCGRRKKKRWSKPITTPPTRTTTTTTNNNKHHTNHKHPTDHTAKHTPTHNNTDTPIHTNQPQTQHQQKKRWIGPKCIGQNWTGQNRP